MFNKGLCNSIGEKELYQQKNRAHEHMQTSSKIPTKEPEIEKAKCSYIILYFFAKKLFLLLLNFCVF